MPVVLHAADEPNEWLVDLLLESGIPDLATAEKVAESVNEKLLVRFNELVAEQAALLAEDKVRAMALALVGSSFDKTPSGRAFRRCVIGDGGRSLADDAGECRCSAPAIHHHCKSIASRLSHLTNGTVSPIVE